MFVCLPFAVRLFVCVCRPKSACQHRSKIARFSNHNTERNIMCTVIKRMYSISRSYKPDERRWLFLGALSFLKHYKLFIIYNVQERISIFFSCAIPTPNPKLKSPMEEACKIVTHKDSDNATTTTATATLKPRKSKKTKHDNLTSVEVGYCCLFGFSFRLGISYFFSDFEDYLNIAATGRI